ncbi:hypothetical protein ACU635_55985 [[Actinomadura] parvosata]|uniref:hypothetical protein n=1 Tax=[Actinomadura] parvosata TaxID=1955412 RepID=UPI00406C30B0
MLRDQLFGARAASARQGPQLGDLDAVAGDVENLPRFDLIHDVGRVVAELSLADDLHRASCRSLV